MTWVRLDDDMLDHPKVARLSPLGLAEHVAGIMWAARNLSDGILPRRVVNRLLDWDGIGVGGNLAAEMGEQEIRATRANGWYAVNTELLPGNLWHDAESAAACPSKTCHDAPPPKEDELLIHDFLVYQRSKEDVLAERDQNRTQRVLAGRRRAASAGRSAGKFTSDEPASEPPPIPASEPADAPARTSGEPATNQRATSPVPVPVPHRSKPRAERERNPAFDALAEATGSNPSKLTRSAARTVAVALAEIAEATSAETLEDLGAQIHQAASRFRQRHATWDLTPMSLAKWWPTCQEIVPESTSTRTVGAVDVKTWEGDPPWVREGLTWEQWQRRENGETDVGPDSARPETGLPSGGLPSGEVESGPALPAEGTG